MVVAGAWDCLRCFAALIWRDRMLVSMEGTAVEFLEVLAVQAPVGSLTGQAGRYSKKVPQPVRTWPDWCARSGTVTCEDRHGGRAAC